MAAARRFAHNRNQSRLEIRGEQMVRGCADGGLSRRGRDCVNHRLAGNTFTEFFENGFLEAPFLDPVLRKIQVRDGHGAAAVRSIHEGDRAGCAATHGFRARRSGNGSGVQDDAGQPVEGGSKKVRLGSAGNATLKMPDGWFPTWPKKRSPLWSTAPRET